MDSMKNEPDTADFRAAPDNPDSRARSEWRGGFLLVLSTTVFMVILAYAYASQQHFEAKVVEEFQRHQLATVRGASSAIQERLREVKVELLELLAPDPSIVGQDQAKYSFALQWVFEKLEGFVNGLYRLDSQGNVLMSYPVKEKQSGAPIPEKTLLKEAPATPRAEKLESLNDPLSALSLSVIASVYKDGVPVGAVRAVVDLRAIVEEFVLTLHATKNSYGLLMNEEGFILHHPRREYLGKTWQEMGEGDFFERFPRVNNRVARDGYFPYPSKVAGADEQLIAFSSVKVGPQRLVLTMVSPRSDIAGPIIRNKRRTWAFVVVLLSIVGMWAFKYNDLRNHKVFLEREREYLLIERELAEEVRATKAYLSALFDSTPDAIISTDREGKVSYFSPGAEVLLGYKAEEVTRLPESVLFDSEERFDELLDQINYNQGRVSAFETVLRTKGGDLIPVLVSASFLLDEEGQQAGTVMFNKDLRERKRAEEELREAHHELQKAYETLEQAQASVIAAEKLAAVGRLSAGVSHEILNPLNIIVMRFHMMMNDPQTPPETVRHIETLQDQASRITKIAKDLLYFSRKRQPERRHLDLNEEVKRTIGLLDYDLKKQNISLELEFAEGLPPVVADTDQLQQVVLNLVTNARDAMPEGGRLVLSTAAAQANGQRFVELRVEDTGQGIAPEHLDKLFEPFFTTKPEGVGTGLGLSICQGIIESHGGYISAKSELGQGTTFVIQLPIGQT